MCEKRIIWHGGAAADSPHRGEPAATRGKRGKGGAELSGAGESRRGAAGRGAAVSARAKSSRRAHCLREERRGRAGPGRGRRGVPQRSARARGSAAPGYGFVRRSEGGPRRGGFAKLVRAFRRARFLLLGAGSAPAPHGALAGVGVVRAAAPGSPRRGTGAGGRPGGPCHNKSPRPPPPPHPTPPAQGAPGPRCPEGRSAAACRERRGTAGCGPGGGSAGSCSGAGRCGDGGAARGGGTARCVLRCVTARGEPRPCSSGHSLKLRSIARRSRSHGPEVGMCAPAAPRHLLAAVSRMSVRWVLLSLVPFCLPRAAAGCPGCSAPFPRGAPRMGPRGPSRGHGLSPSSSRGCPTSLLPPPAAAAAELLTGSVAQEVKAGEGPLGIGDCWQTGAGRSWECIPPCSQTAEQLSIPRRAARGNGSMDSRDHEVGEEQGQRR